MGDESIQNSLGNVFADLGLDEAPELLWKATIVRKVSEIIRSKRLTQAKAASVLGIDQPKVSALLKGQLSGFSLERLFRFLIALDQEVEIRIRPRIGKNRRKRKAAL